MTRVACVSDLHEQFDDVSVPPCDLLIVAGDITYGFHGDYASQQRVLINEFKQWLIEQPAGEVVVIAGNHDQSIEEWGWPPDYIPCHYLQDEGVRVCGLNVWGTPWQPWFYSWGFNAPQRDDDECFLQSKFELIPPDTDIVVCHGPPRGYGDRVGDPGAPNRDGQPRVGSQAMTKRLREIRPRLMVCGHIHSDPGQWTLRDRDGSELPTKIINAAVVDNRYQVVREPVVIDL